MLTGLIILDIQIPLNRIQSKELHKPFIIMDME